MATSSLGTTLRGLCGAYPIALALLSAGCGLASDSEGCGDRVLPDVVDIRFVPTITDPGDYRIRFSSSVLTGTCDVSVGSIQLAPCSNARLSVDGESENGTIILAALRAWFDYGPDRFELTISREDVVVISDLYTPQYELDEPNGRGCGERQRAEVAVSIP
jgi:hypothetical protein